MNSFRSDFRKVCYEIEKIISLSSNEDIFFTCENASQRISILKLLRRRLKRREANSYYLFFDEIDPIDQVLTYNTLLKAMLSIVNDNYPSTNQSKSNDKYFLTILDLQILIEQVIEKLSKLKLSKHIIILINFSNYNNDPKVINSLNFFRSIIQKSQGFIWVFIGSKQFVEATDHGGVSPFHNIFRIIYMD